jgi:hypothetical protein
MKAIPAANVGNNNLLSEHPPRRVQLTSATKHRRFYLYSFLTCVALIVCRQVVSNIQDLEVFQMWKLVIGLGLFIFGLIIFHFESLYQTQLHVCQNGILVNAKIIRKWEDIVEDSKTTYIACEFLTQDNQLIMYQEQVKNNIRWEVGDVFPLLYDPKNTQMRYPLEACIYVEFMVSV